MLTELSSPQPRCASGCGDINATAANGCLGLDWLRGASPGLPSLPHHSRAPKDWSASDLAAFTLGMYFFYKDWDNIASLVGTKSVSRTLGSAPASFLQ
jgi:hypothetical protein